MKIVTQVAWEVCHRPKGFELVETGVDPNQIVYFLASDNGGAGRWRSYWPAEALRSAGVNAKSGMAFPGGLQAGDTIVFHRPLMEEALDFIRSYRAAGVRVLVDEDDDLTALPETFDEYVRDKVKEVTPEHDAAIAVADGLVVTTERLEKVVYGSMARRVFRCPNYMPAWLLDVEPEPVTDNAVRVGWAGITRTHLHDLRWLAPVLPAITERALFSTVGDPETPRVIGQPICEWFGHEFDVKRYYEKMARADVGMVPLKPDEPLNWSKSYIKALEYMAFGVPVVAADLPEQRLLIEHGVSGFLSSDPEEFACYVRMLVDDDEARMVMGKAARARAAEFLIDDNIECWMEALS